jgi:uncharacterized protein YgiM (DUF1202 family)
MKRFLFSFSLFVALALHPAAGLGAPQSDSGPLPDRQVNAKADPCVRLRAGASLDRNVLDCLEPGTQLRLLGAISGWSHVRLADGTEGWVDSLYLEIAPQIPTERSSEIQSQEAPPTQPPAPEANDRVAALQEQIAALEGQLEAAAGRRESTEERLRKTVEAAETAQREASRLTERVQQLESAAAQGNDQEQLESELASARARIDELQGALAGAEERLLRAADQNAEQERRIETLDASLVSGRAREEEQKQALAAAEARVQAAEETGKSQTHRIQQLENDLAATSARIDELDSSQAHRIQQLTSELANAESRTAEAELRAQLARHGEPPPQAPTENLIKVRAPIVSMPEEPKVAVRMPAAMSEEEASTETPAELPATDAAIDAVRAWAAAWSDQRVADYLSHYALGFQPPSGLSRGDWEAQRQLRLAAPSYIRVTISALSAELTDESTVRVTFGQEYESDTFADSVSKVLILAAEDGAWRILEERATP